MAIATPNKTTLEKKHVDYSANEDRLEFLSDAYFGTGGFRDGTHLIQYTNESTAKYTERKNLAYYPNLVKAVVKTYSGHLFKQEPTRDTKDPILSAFIDKCTLKGNKGINSFMEEVFNLAKALGYCYVLVDSPSTLVTTAADERDMDIRPYASIISPLSITNWGLDSRGNFAWIIIKETYTENGEIPFVDHTQRTRYRYWDKNEWIIYNSTETEVTEVASGTHNLGKVPIVPVYYEELSGSIIGVSGVEEIAQLNKRLYNLLSELDDILRSQTFALLVVQGELEGETFGVDTDRSITIPDDAKHMPQYISPDTSATQAYEARIEAITDVIYRIAKLHHDGVTTQTAEMSGIARMLLFQKTEQELQSNARFLTVAEMNIYSLVLAWVNKTVDNIEDIITVSYADQFGLMDHRLIIEATQDALNIGISSETFTKELQKKLAYTLLPDIDKPTKDAITKEIDESETLVNIDGSSLDNEGILENFEPDTTEETETNVFSNNTDDSLKTYIKQYVTKDK